MPLKYNAASAAPLAPLAPVMAATTAPSIPGDSTRAALFNPDGSPKPIRNLGALREKLAGSGGVNPTESKVPDTALEPRTEETPDGGAAPIGLLPETPTTKRTRRTPAQMAEAKALIDAAKAAQSASAGVAPSAAGSASRAVRDFTTDELLAELYRRLRGES